MSVFRHLASWLLAAALIAFFLHITLHPWPNPVPGYVKLYDAPGDHLLFATLAERSGVSLFEPAGRLASGIIELFAALLLVFPASRRLGAAIAVLCLGAGVALHLSPWLGRELVLPEGGTDGGTHFLVYVMFLALSLLLLFVHPVARSRF